MKTKTPFQWRETSSGTYKRDLDECEKFYRLYARNESSCFPVTSSASFTVNTAIRDGPAIKDAFRKAWLTLRYRHPTLASRVEHDALTGQWLRVYNANEDKEDQKTFSVHYASDALEWFNRDAPDFEHASVYLVPSQTGNDSPWAVFLRCPHDITDGIGVLQLLDQLFVYAAKALEQGSEYATPTWGDEAVCLSPCLRVAADIPDTLSSSQSQRLDDIKAQNAALYNHERLLGLPSSRSPPSPSGRRERIPFPLSENTTREILTRCKRIGTGVRVTHVFMAALALVLAQFQGPRDTKEDAREFRYVNHSMINLRPYCQPPYNGPDHAAAAYHTISAQALAIDVDVDVTAPRSSPPDLAQAVCKVRDSFKATFSDTDSRSDQIAFACVTFKSITPAPGANIHAVSETPFCPVPLSSLGNVSNIVAKRHGAIEVQHVWAASEPIGAGVALFLGTWEGNLELSAVFDTRYHEREVVRVFLESIVRCVCDGLDVV